MKPAYGLLDDYDFEVSSSAQDKNFVKIAGNNLKIEGSGLTISGNPFTFSSDVSKCQVELDKTLRASDTSAVDN